MACLQANVMQLSRIHVQVHVRHTSRAYVRAFVPCSGNLQAVMMSLKGSHRTGFIFYTQYGLRLLFHYPWKAPFCGGSDRPWDVQDWYRNPNVELLTMPCAVYRKKARVVLFLVQRIVAKSYFIC